MEMLSQGLPVVIYFLLIVLIIILIVLGIRLISIMNKVDKVVDNITDKVESLNGLFNIVDYATDKISLLSDSLISFITTALGKIFKKFKKEEEIDE